MIIENFLRDNPKNEFAWLNIFVFFEKTQLNLDSMRLLAQKALKFNPNSAKLYSQIGIIFAELDQKSNKTTKTISETNQIAEIYLKQAVELSPKNAKFWTNLGIFYLYIKRAEGRRFLIVGKDT